MYYKNIFVVITAFSLLYGLINAKKSKKNKPPRLEEEITLQPDVVSYSSFGFNDVGSYDGFVPSSPDYTSFLSGMDRESTTRLYGPAFPTALDSTGFSSNYAPNLFNSQPLGGNYDVTQESGMLNYPQNTINFFNTPTAIKNDEKENNRNEDFPAHNTDELSNPVYGTKLNSKNKKKQTNQFNDTGSHNQLNVFSSLYTNPSDDKFFSVSDASPTYERKPIQTQANVSYHDIDNLFQNNPAVDTTSYPKLTNVFGSLNFPRVVDFTKINQFDATGVDIASPLTSKPLNSELNSVFKGDSDNTYTNSYNHHINKVRPYNFKSFKVDNDTPTKPSSFNEQTLSHSDSTTQNKKYSSGNKSGIEHKNKLKKPWSAANYTNYFKNWKDLSLKGYQYSTNNSHMTYKYNDSKKQSENSDDEVKPASSNLIDFTHYQFPEPDFTNIKPVVEDEYASYQPFRENIKQSDYSNQFKNQLFSTPPTTTSSYWGNTFKSAEYFSTRNHPRKPQLTEDTADSEDFVTIPKAPSKSIYNKLPDNKFTDWPYGPQKLFEPNKPSKELYNTIFKSEEDLLGLRNHDTSHPSYLPTFNPSLNSDDDDSSYKKLVNRWKESYLKAKYKDSPLHDHENYASDSLIHVPLPRPYPIEIPHPVIVPVLQPYPIRVPVSKPVAVPVVQEIIVPIEKPVPYPVFKNVPYPIEKLVPVHVEKEVTMPVPKPYPVHISNVRPVFHHTKPSHDDNRDIDLEENDYFPQSSRNNQHYRKRPYSSRNVRTRRPSRTIYDRNRRRWPERRRPAPSTDQRRRRPSAGQSRYKYHEQPEYTEDESDYDLYCKRTRNC